MSFKMDFSPDEWENNIDFFMAHPSNHDFTREVFASTQFFDMIVMENHPYLTVEYIQKYLLKYPYSRASGHLIGSLFYIDRVDIADFLAENDYLRMGGRDVYNNHKKLTTK